MHSKAVIRQLNLTSYVLKRNVEGISHEDSLRQPQPGGNSMNWVVGHIVKTRNEFLKILSGSSPFPASKYRAYGSEPLTRASDAARLDELLSDYDAMQKPLEDAIQKADMTAKAPFSPTNNPDETIGSLLVALAFHEAYHLGQTGLQRRLYAKPGAIKAPGQPQAA
jgi:uncharacterized damage-inducible protein DinB